MQPVSPSISAPAPTQSAFTNRLPDKPRRKGAPKDGHLVEANSRSCYPNNRGDVQCICRVAAAREVLMQVLATPRHGHLKAIALTFGALVLIAGSSLTSLAQELPKASAEEVGMSS